MEVSFHGKESFMDGRKFTSTDEDSKSMGKNREEENRLHTEKTVFCSEQFNIWDQELKNCVKTFRFHFQDNKETKTACAEKVSQ